MPVTDFELDMHVSPEQLTAEARRGLVKGLHQATEHVLTMTGPKVPWRSGDLEQSGSPSIDEAELVGVVSYDEPYAARQHEEVGYDHPIKGESKFLEKTLYEEAEVVKAKIAAELRKALRG